jgi:hypothetical protein
MLLAATPTIAAASPHQDTQVQVERDHGARASHDTDVARYAAAEKAAPHAQRFHGGAAVVIIGSTTVLVALLLLLLLV